MQTEINRVLTIVIQEEERTRRENMIVGKTTHASRGLSLMRQSSPRSEPVQNSRHYSFPSFLLSFRVRFISFLYLCFFIFNFLCLFTLMSFISGFFNGACWLLSSRYSCQTLSRSPIRWRKGCFCGLDDEIAIGSATALAYMIFPSGFVYSVIVMVVLQDRPF